ncbi:hypothetical protein H0A58_10775 [Alcaligenaceae bacterium]|nr:hypothetical protein [Alcaligenaceae bacterium]
MRNFSIFSTPDGLSDDSRLKRRRMLARLGLAWLAMMQVMMFALPGYLRSDSASVDSLRALDSAILLMNWLGFALTVPVMLYCAAPVWSGAYSSLRRGVVGMDVPVALGIIVAFIPSVYTTLTGSGEVYFESVTMFVAFLLTARYLELCARQSMGINASHDVIERLREGLSARADTVAFWFVVVQLALAFIVGGWWYVYQPEHAVGVMVALLVMSCPCAMAMAVPTAMAAAHASLSVCPDATETDVMHLVQAASHVSRQNLYGSVAWHLLMTPLAAIGLVAPWVAAITMLLSSLLVAANSWRLFRTHTHGTAVAWSNSVVQG